MERKGSRRGFIAEVFTRVAGGCIALGGMVGLFSAFSGCDTAEKYGPAPKYGAIIDQGPAPKYGALIDVGPVVKYGPLFDGGGGEGLAPKYGIKLDGGSKG